VITLTPSLVSRLHFSIDQRGEDYFITDLNSKNGTFVNGVKIAANGSLVLQQNDRIALMSNQTQESIAIIWQPQKQ
jgi:pSer/pThr/pTyr-binding forkhead associated (FHA) protein